MAGSGCCGCIPSVVCTGSDRVAILGYHVDGANLVTLAMNGWGDGEPAWWLNLMAHPDAFVELKGGTRIPVRARAASGRSVPDSGRCCTTTLPTAATSMPMRPCARPRPRSSSSSLRPSAPDGDFAAERAAEAGAQSAEAAAP